eukprot:gene37716-6129_t
MCGGGALRQKAARLFAHVPPPVGCARGAHDELRDWASDAAELCGELAEERWPGSGAAAAAAAAGVADAVNALKRGRERAEGELALR